MSFLPQLFSVVLLLVSASHAFFGPMDYNVNLGFDNVAVGALHPLNAWDKHKTAILISEFGSVGVMNTAGNEWSRSTLLAGPYPNESRTFIQSCTAIIVSPNLDYMFVTVDTQGVFYSYNITDNKVQQVFTSNHIPNVASCVITGSKVNPAVGARMVVLVKTTNDKELSVKVVNAPLFEVLSGGEAITVDIPQSFSNAFGVLIDDPEDVEIQLSFGINCRLQDGCNRVDLLFNTTSANVTKIFSDPITNGNHHVVWGVTVDTAPTKTLWWFAADGTSWSMNASATSSAENNLTIHSADPNWKSTSALTNIVSTPTIGNGNIVYFSALSNQTYKIELWGAQFTGPQTFAYTSWSGKEVATTGQLDKPAWMTSVYDSMIEYLWISTSPNRNYPSPSTVYNYKRVSGSDPIFNNLVTAWSPTPRDFVFGFSIPSTSNDNDVTTNIPRQAPGGKDLLAPGSTWLLSGNCPPDWVHVQTGTQVYTAPVDQSCGQIGYARAGAALKLSAPSTLWMLTDPNDAFKQKLQTFDLSGSLPLVTSTYDMSLLNQAEPNAEYNFMLYSSQTANLYTLDTLQHQLVEFNPSSKSIVNKQGISLWYPLTSKGTVSNLFIHPVQHLGGKPDHLFILYENSNLPTHFGFCQLDFSNYMHINNSLPSQNGEHFIIAQNYDHENITLFEVTFGHAYTFSTSTASIHPYGAVSTPWAISAQSFVIDTAHGVGYAIGVNFGTSIVQYALGDFTVYYQVNVFPAEIGFGVLVDPSTDDGLGSIVLASGYPLPSTSTSPGFAMVNLLDAAYNVTAQSNLLPPTPVTTTTTGPSTTGPSTTGPSTTGPSTTTGGDTSSNQNSQNKTPDQGLSPGGTAVLIICLLILLVGGVAVAHKKGWIPNQSGVSEERFNTTNSSSGSLWQRDDDIGTPATSAHVSTYGATDGELVALNPTVS